MREREIESVSEGESYMLTLCMPVIHMSTLCGHSHYVALAAAVAGLANSSNPANSSTPAGIRFL